MRFRQAHPYTTNTTSGPAYIYVCTPEGQVKERSRFCRDPIRARDIPPYNRCAVTFSRVPRRIRVVHVLHGEHSPASGWRPSIGRSLDLARVKDVRSGGFTCGSALRREDSVDRPSERSRGDNQNDMARVHLLLLVVLAESLHAVPGRLSGMWNLFFSIGTLSSITVP